MSLEGRAHLFPLTARVNEKGHLEIGGCDTVELAREFGTPLYVFCEETLRQACRRFLSAFRGAYGEAEVIYACKAYINPALALLFLEEGLGLDVVSGGEMAVARRVGFPPERVYFHGNNKSATELREALDYGVGRVVVDGLEELALLSRLAGEARRRQAVLLRITPGVDPHTHAHTTTGVLDSKFGFPLATGQAEEAVRRALASPSLELVGLHFHLGSPIFQVEPYIQAVRLTVAFAARSRALGLKMGELGVGGGFAIAYTADQHPPGPEDYAVAIAGAVRRACQEAGLPLPRLVVEPGRAIVGPAAVALYTVGAVKEIPGVRTYLALDGGMGDNIRPALYGAAYEAVPAGRMNAPATRRFTLAGRFCESGDILVREALLPDMAPGDLIALPASGAYNLSMASNYNLTGRPAVVLVRQGRARLIRRRETYSDLMRCDLW